MTIFITALSMQIWITFIPTDILWTLKILSLCSSPRQFLHLRVLSPPRRFSFRASPGDTHCLLRSWSVATYLYPSSSFCFWRSLIVLNCIAFKFSLSSESYLNFALLRPTLEDSETPCLHIRCAPRSDRHWQFYII